MVGTSNQLAHAAACRVTDANVGAPVTFNPLFIHSAGGPWQDPSAQCHRLRIREHHPDARCCSSPPSASCTISSGAADTRHHLLQGSFQSIDVLLIDDFQFLQGKSMQQEFCHTFNSLVDSKRQVDRGRRRAAGSARYHRPAHALAADGRPRGRYRIARSRIAPQNRARPLCRRWQPRSIRWSIPDEVLEFIANRITGGGRELEGALEPRHRLSAVQPVARSRSISPPWCCATCRPIRTSAGSGSTTS